MTIITASPILVIRWQPRDSTAKINTSLYAVYTKVKSARQTATRTQNKKPSIIYLTH